MRKVQSALVKRVTLSFCLTTKLSLRFSSVLSDVVNVPKLILLLPPPTPPTTPRWASYVNLKPLRFDFVVEGTGAPCMFRLCAAVFSLFSRSGASALFHCPPPFPWMWGGKLNQQFCSAAASPAVLQDRAMARALCSGNLLVQLRLEAGRRRVASPLMWTVEPKGRFTMMQSSSAQTVFPNMLLQPP